MEVTMALQFHVVELTADKIGDAIDFLFNTDLISTSFGIDRIIQTILSAVRLRPESIPILAQFSSALLKAATSENSMAELKSCALGTAQRRLSIPDPFPNEAGLLSFLFHAFKHHFLTIDDIARLTKSLLEEPFAAQSTAWLLSYFAPELQLADPNFTEAVIARVNTTAGCDDWPDALKQFAENMNDDRRNNWSQLKRDREALNTNQLTFGSKGKGDDEQCDDEECTDEIPDEGSLHEKPAGRRSESVAWIVPPRMRMSFDEAQHRAFHSSPWTSVREGHRRRHYERHCRFREALSHPVGRSVELAFIAQEAPYVLDTAVPPPALIGAVQRPSDQPQTSRLIASLQTDHSIQVSPQLETGHDSLTPLRNLRLLRRNCPADPSTTGTESTKKDSPNRDKSLKKSVGAQETTRGSIENSPTEETWRSLRIWKETTLRKVIEEFNQSLSKPRECPKSRYRPQP
jgi:hypothetical protein